MRSIIMVRNRLIGRPLMVYGSDTPNIKTLEFLSAAHTFLPARRWCQSSPRARTTPRFLFRSGAWEDRIRLEDDQVAAAITSFASAVTVSTTAPPGTNPVST